VWELPEQRWVYVKEDRRRAGRSVVTVFLDDLDARVTAIAARRTETGRL
jgi:hypothetical protein